MAWVKLAKNVRRLTLRSSSGSGTNTSPGVTWIRSSRCGDFDFVGRHIVFALKDR